MGKDNNCKAVYNVSIPGKVRIACSVCGTIWDENVKGTCPKCGRHIKPSKVSMGIKE